MKSYSTTASTGTSKTAFLIASMAKYHEMYALLTLIYSHLDKECGGIRHARYKYLCYAIIADLLGDLMRLRFSFALQKIRFLSKLVNKKQT